VSGFTGDGGTIYEVEAHQGWISLSLASEFDPLNHWWEGSLTIEESEHLRLLLEEAEIESKPKAPKAERIRERIQEFEQFAGWSPLAQDIRRILDEDGDL
jgi:hypothetical protein